MHPRHGRRSHFSPLLRVTLVCGLIGAGCTSPDLETTASLSQPVNVCNESIPESRFVDGLPAYAQCAEVASGNVWSNNGVDTSTSSLGPDWVQTQRGGGYQCTEWAYRYLRFRFGISYRSGDAKEWCDGNLPSTLVKSDEPVHGDLIVFDGGVCGSDAKTGHVAVIDEVNADASSVTFVEQNQAGRRTAKTTCAKCFLHAVANDGTPASGTGGGASTGGAAAQGGTAGSSPSNANGGAGGGAAEPAGGAAPLGGASMTMGGAAGLATGGAGSGGAPPEAPGGTGSGGATLPTLPSTGGSGASAQDDFVASSATCSLVGRPPADDRRGASLSALGVCLGLALRTARKARRRAG